MPRESRSGLTPQIIEALKRQGANQNDIAAEFGVSRQYVSEVKHQVTGFSMTPRERVARSFPWRVKSEHHGASLHKRMRDHAEYMVTRGKGMSEGKLRRLVGLYKRLQDQDLVVEYAPTIPPSDGNSAGGWRLVPRENSDGDLMIRVNEFTSLDDKDRPLWRIPSRWPEIN